MIDTFLIKRTADYVEVSRHYPILSAMPADKRVTEADIEAYCQGRSWQHDAMIAALRKAIESRCVVAVRRSEIAKWWPCAEVVHGPDADLCAKHGGPVSPTTGRTMAVKLSAVTAERDALLVEVERLRAATT